MHKIGKIDLNNLLCNKILLFNLISGELPESVK